MRIRRVLSLVISLMRLNRYYMSCNGQPVSTVSPHLHIVSPVHALIQSSTCGAKKTNSRQKQLMKYQIFIALCFARLVHLWATIGSL